MHAVAFLGLLGIGLTAHIILAVYQHFVSPLRSIPGPFLARFTDLWYFYQLRKGRFEVINQQLHEKYGATVLGLQFHVHDALF